MTGTRPLEAPAPAAPHEDLPEGGEAQSQGAAAVLARAGWLSPDEVRHIQSLIDLLIEGRYLQVAPGGDRVSARLHELAQHLVSRGGETLRQAIQISVAINDSVVDAAELTRSITEVSQRTETIAAAAEELVASVESIGENTDGLAGDAESVRELTAKSQATAQRAVGTMENISRAVTEAASRVDRLSGASEEISKIVTLIEQIAFSTNMLALNASVEAARAGEAGRGFAVVAEEVKRLADQTKRATVDIGARITGLREDMAKIVRSMHAVGLRVEEGSVAIRQSGAQMQQISGRTEVVADRIRDIASIISQQRQAAQEVAQSIVVVSEMMEESVRRIEHNLDGLDQATSQIEGQIESVSALEMPNVVIQRSKADHVIWKKRLAAMMVGRTQINADELADHHSCRLGRWYDQVRDPALRDQTAFARLADPHRDVHDAGREAARLYQEGDFDGALHALQRVAQASGQVLDLLDQLAP